MAPTSHTKIFVSYRRTDTRPEAGYLTQSLRHTFGTDRVFKDDEIRAGDDYPDVLQAELDESTIVLALVGSDWLTATTGEFGVRRLHEPADWVRREIRTALEQNKLLIPLLVDGGKLPDAQTAKNEQVIPSDIAGIVLKQSLELRNDHWPKDVGFLVAQIAEETGWPTSTEPTAQPPNRLRLFGRPPLVVQNFQERADLLTEIDDASSTVLSAVNGIGGVGKSQLAAKYFELNQSRYGYAVWIDMRDQDGRTGMTELTQALGLTQPGVDPVDTAVNFIKDSDGTWLLVFDNADNPEQVRRVLPTGSHIKTVVTSRWRNWGNFGTPINISVFDPDTALRFLSESTGLAADQDARQLTEELGYLPLAIGLAGAFISNRRLTYADYRQRLPGDLIAALSPSTPGNYDPGIKMLWQDSLDSAAATNPNCLDLIRSLALIDWTYIGRAWLESRTPLSRDELEEALVTLDAYSLIEFGRQRVTITHNLIADGIASLTTPNDGDHLIQLLKGAINEQGASREITEAAEEPIRHISHLVRNHPHLIVEPLLDPIQDAVSQVFHQGISDSTLEKSAVALHENILGPQHPDTLTTRSNLAKSYWQAGRTQEAINIEEQLLTDSENILGPQHPDTLTTRGNLAASYKQAGRTQEAINIFEQLLTDRENILGPQHPNTLTTRGNLAASYWHAGRTQEAINIEEQLLTDSENILGPQHPNTLTTRSNLAKSYWQAGRTQEAINIGEQLLTDSENILGPQHPNTLTTRSNLAASYKQAGRTQEAINIFEQLLTDRENILGPQHPQTLRTRSNLAASYKQAGHVADAERLEAEAPEGNAS